MSNAVSMFLKQVVLQRGTPFEMKLPRNKPVAMGALTMVQLNAKLQKGFDDMKAGRVKRGS